MQAGKMRRNLHHRMGLRLPGNPGRVVLPWGGCAPLHAGGRYRYRRHPACM